VVVVVVLVLVVVVVAVVIVAAVVVVIVVVVLVVVVVVVLHIYFRMTFLCLWVCDFFFYCGDTCIVVLERGATLS
jgi:hypothetical protein